MSAVDKTKSLKRLSAPIGELEANDYNPNEMTDSEFNMLCDNIEAVGITDPILVREKSKKTKKYKIIGGEHRWEAAKIMGFSEVPITVITDGEFDDDMEKFQVVRHNIIHGKMSAEKFMNMYQGLSKKYSEQVAAELFGFTDEEEFRKLIAATAKSLPKEMQPAFKNAAKELKTIDELSALLNHMFSTHGDTLPYGYMIVDFGGKDSIWLRMQKGQKEKFLKLAEVCISMNKSMDAVISKMLETFMAGNSEDFTMEHIVQGLPDVIMPEEKTKVIPTLDFLDQL